MIAIRSLARLSSAADALPSCYRACSATAAAAVSSSLQAGVQRGLRRGRCASSRAPPPPPQPPPPSAPSAPPPLAAAPATTTALVSGGGGGSGSSGISAGSGGSAGGGGAGGEGSRWMEPVDMPPREVVAKLSQHVIGQEAAKKAIALALRNRWRRLRLSQEEQSEVIPKNILMVGPTGCGKTEIARRLAKLCRAPFVKVEATKFTEVGYHGRDVDTIIKDLMDASLELVRELKTEQLRGEVKPAIEARILEALMGPGAAEDTVESFRALLRSGALDDREIVIDVPVRGGGDARGGGGGGASPPSPSSASPSAAAASALADLDVSMVGVGVGPGGASIDLGEFMQRIMPGSGGGGGGGGGGSSSRRAAPTARRSVKIAEARALLEEAEVERRLSSQDLRKEAVALAEQNGIVVIDEIDKIISNKSKHSGDASAEGVQRDLLPLIEGTAVEVRRFGNVRTDYMLFIACGAFHEHKPAELLAELQGRLPIRVELRALDARDLERILTETRFNLLQQQVALLAAEGVQLHFAPDAVAEIARLAAQINRQVENIGARRLHTVIERIMEDISFAAPELPRGQTVTVDVQLVRDKLLPLLEKQDLAKFIL